MGWQGQTCRAQAGKAQGDQADERGDACEGSASTRGGQPGARAGDKNIKSSYNHL